MYSQRINNFRINLNAKKELGQGAQGTVYRGRNLKTNERVAAKRTKGVFKEYFNAKEFENEADLLINRIPPHENIIKVYDFAKTEYENKGIPMLDLWLITEVCEFGNLKEFAFAHDLSIEQKIGIMYQLALAVRHLHGCKPESIAHRDVKPENILVTGSEDDPIIKLGDFGSARSVIRESEKSVEMGTLTGTTLYLAPEQFELRDGHFKYNKQVDIFSLGVTFLALLNAVNGSLMSPETIDEKGLGETMWIKHKQNQDFTFPIHKSSDSMLIHALKCVIERMIMFEPSSRLNADEVVEELSKVKCRYILHPSSTTVPRLQPCSGQEQEPTACRQLPVPQEPSTLQQEEPSTMLHQEPAAAVSRPKQTTVPRREPCSGPQQKPTAFSRPKPSVAVSRSETSLITIQELYSVPRPEQTAVPRQKPILIVRQEPSTITKPELSAVPQLEPNAVSMVEPAAALLERPSVVPWEVPSAFSRQEPSTSLHSEQALVRLPEPTAVPKSQPNPVPHSKLSEVPRQRIPVSRSEPQRMPQSATAKKSWELGTKVVTMFPFKATHNNELSFEKYDILTITKATQDPNYYQAKDKNGEIGMIRMNYVRRRRAVQLHPMPWYHGKMTAQQVHAVLKEEGASKSTPTTHRKHQSTCRDTGTFFVYAVDDEAAKHSAHKYTLCIVGPSKRLREYSILYENYKLTIFWDEFFENISQLVQFYEHRAGHLCTKLKEPLVSASSLSVCVHSVDFLSESWAISREEVHTHDLCCSGLFTDVHKGFYSGSDVFIRKRKDPYSVQDTLIEAAIMSGLSHKNVVQLIGVVLGEETLIVTEYLGKGRLSDYLQSRGYNGITSQDQLNFARDVCEGMHYLEQKNIVHRKLMAQSILVSDEGTAKVGDFTLAHPVERNKGLDRYKVKWTAPELLLQQHSTSKSDMWSFGVLLWEIYSLGSEPYPGMLSKDVLPHLMQGRRLEAPEECPDEIYQIMSAVWDIDPAKRPTFSDVCKSLDCLHIGVAITHL